MNSSEHQTTATPEPGEASVGRPAARPVSNPPPTKPAPVNRKSLGLIAAAFLVGVIGTATVTSRRTPSPASQATEVATNPNAEQPKSDAQPQVTLIKIDTAAMKNAGIQTRLVTFASLAVTMTAPGTVEANPSSQAKITPPVAGKLARILVKQGDTVRAGQALAVLDSYDVAQAHAAVRDAQLGVGQAIAAVQTAQAQVGQSRAKLDSTQTTLARQRQFAQAGAFSQAPLLAVQSEVSQAQSELSQAQTELRTKTAAAGRAGRLIQDQLISKSEMEQAQADQEQTQARVDQAKTRLSLAKQSLNREQKVFGGDLLSKQVVQTAQADVRAAQSELQTGLRQTQVTQTALQSARGRVGAARDNLSALEGGGHTEGGAGLVTLYAPLGGVVTERAGTLGETVERSTALLTISNTSAVLVQANVPERDAARVRVGQSVEITVPTYAGQTFTGIVQTLGSSVDEKTRSLPVRCLVENRDGRLKPEMFARVTLSTGKGGIAAFVPSAAIDEDGEKRFVYIAKNGGYEKRAVQIGRVTDAKTQIVSGVEPGESVVTEGVFVLKSESKKSEMKGDSD